MSVITTAARTTRRMSARERSEQVIDVAEQLFCDKGFDRTSIGDIADAAGVSRPIVYEHHGSKEGIYIAALERAKRQIRNEYLIALDGITEPREVLRAVLDVYLSMVERDPRRWVLLYGGAAVPLTGDLGERLAEVRTGNADYYGELLQAWVDPTITPQQASQLVPMIFGAANSLATWWLDHMDVPRSRIVDQLTEFCWSGLTTVLSMPD